MENLRRRTKGLTYSIFKHGTPAHGRGGLQPARDVYTVAVKQLHALELEVTSCAEVNPLRRH